MATYRPRRDPEQLCRFVASEWPGDDPVRDWRNACRDWLRAGDGRALPFGEHGDLVDLVRECYRIRVAMIRDL